MGEENRQIMVMISMVERGHGSSLAKLYSRYQVWGHYQSMGHGTASSELLDLLGFAGKERDILISFGTAACVRFLMKQLREELQADTKGIVCSVPLTGINHITAAGLWHQPQPEKGKEESMEQNSSSMILVTVNQGYTEEVMNTARAAGARGGTVLRARWAGEESVKQFFGITLQEEKEIIAIVVSRQNRNTIMEMIHKNHGLKTSAEAMICSIELEETLRLG